MKKIVIELPEVLDGKQIDAIADLLEGLTGCSVSRGVHQNDYEEFSRELVSIIQGEHSQ